MKKALVRVLCGMALVFTTGVAVAQERMEHLDLGRGAARLPVYVMPNPDATATLVLLPGGDAGTGKVVDGRPGSNNFLSRSRELFVAQGFNVMVVYRPTDLADLEYGYRVSKAHVGEVATAVAYAKQSFGKPVWLVGTSRGTVSATATAIALGAGEVQGLVLSSSVTSKKTGAIATQNIAGLTMPVLVVHNKKDACPICVPAEASHIIDYLNAATVKKVLLVDGGSDPQGDACGASHWHGYVNYEKETVTLITDWVKNPHN